MTVSSAPAGETFRDQFTGKEDQGPYFAVPYTDFDARHYSPALSRWLVPDPLSEKYYDASPYVYCNGNTLMLVDVDGKKWLNPILIKCLKKNVNDRILELKNNSDRQEIKERVSFLQKSLIDIEILAIDEENYYALSYNWDDAHYVRKGTGGIVFLR